MSAQSNLTESECLALIKYVCDTLTSKSTERAVAAIIEHLRLAFNVSCVSIREVFARPYSLKYTYESLNDKTKEKRINETVTFDEDVWESAMDKFSDGCYIYKADNGQDKPRFIGPVPNRPMCMLQMPMYSGSKFYGVLDLVDFVSIHDWNEYEIAALKVCANFICQYLCRLNNAFTKTKDSSDADSLTGLMGLHAFMEDLDKKILETKNGSPIAVVYIDIHHFKYINETYGYKKGDDLLKLAAQAISDNISQYSHIDICRAYADNFVSSAFIPEQVVPIFDTFVHEQNVKICKKLQSICPDVRIHINVGICYVTEPSITAATAIANANLARKVAKSEGINKPLVFSSDMMEEIKYQEYLNNELPKAIENHDLKVYYQPKINCSDDSLYGAEALVRWQKPDGTFIYPDKFIPVFEKNGNIVEVDFYVYREVFKYIRKRLDNGLPVFPISMNVSRVHFRSNRIVPYVEELLKEYAIPPSLVEFELTENIYMNNFSKADEFISKCRSHGIQVSMDDFGSGYSSLNVISTIKIDTLKIDKIFLKSDKLSDSDKAVIETMISMAKRLGMKVICEGVETESQANFLKDVNCDQIQGYYYGKPMDEESFDRFAERSTIKTKI